MTRRVSPVKVTRADGTVEVHAPYAPKVLRAILDTPNVGAAPPWHTAKHPTTCAVCHEDIDKGDRIEFRGWEHRLPVHHACAPRWGTRPG